ncbi:MAG TPA: phytanoyl-CoA dioxygenase family protein [Thermoanaerobaculia bacterium]|jgi:ectoine hydroxylase-related dioxygenase (phytanoyl-CoA dioxygenase family)|nr:phytanoyl-CoA dioxygenase family protein [Thermoanaerobaculia bacterium]
MERTRRLAPQQVESYRRNGILFPIPALTPGEVSDFRSAVEDLERRLGGKPAPVQMAQPQLHFRWAYDLATHPAVLDAIEDVLGPNILIHSASIFSKHPHTPDYVSWHQDGYYWELDEPRLASAWIALTDSTAENGCMRVVPGSQEHRRLPHNSSPGAKDNLLAIGLEIAVEVAESEALDVVLRAGEMSLHHVNIVHGSNPNRSGGKRIGFAVRYVAPEVRQTLEHHEVLLARGRDDHHHYRVLEGPPAYTLEEGLAAQAEFSRRRIKARIGNLGSAPQGS